MDAPQQANSGHPGTAMALAPLAHVLWTRVMSYDPSDPDWPDRDRFVLSCGHACILLYSMLYLTGYGVELEDLRQFRQLHSRTPGPPRGARPARHRGHDRPARAGLRQRRRPRAWPSGCCEPASARTSSTTTPSSSAATATSWRGSATRPRRSPAISASGRLIYVYDDNHITIDGPTELTLNDDAGQRFEAYGWHVDRLGRGRQRHRRPRGRACAGPWPWRTAPAC